MVRLVILLLALTGAAVPAQGADWARAGGPLFVGAALPASTRSPDRDPVQVERPDLPFALAVALAAERHGLDPKLLHALVAVESAYRPEAVSAAGAAGLAQLMPGTAAELGVRDRFDPSENLAAGADYLAQQLVRFGDVKLALAAYSAGPERVARLGRIPQIAETQAHVTAVVDCYLALAAGRSIRSRRDCRPQGLPQ